MKSEIPTPQISIEQAPSQPGPTIESGINIPSPETGIETSAEKYEQVAEASAVKADVSMTTILPTPVVDDKVVVDGTTVLDSPLVAKDDDLIEKEWVDKAKKIVSQTKNDPHQREKQVSKLQVDYIKKRFGRELGEAE